ncbi:MAG: glycosyltransferase family 4 protein [Muribaculaceae bacterium]
MLNIYQIVSDKQWGGPEQYAFDLTAQMREDPDNFYMEIVTQNRPKIIKHFRRLEIPISTLPLKSLSDLDSPIRLARQIKRGRNILHVHNMKDAATAVLANKISENPNNRIVLTSHSIERPKTGFMYRRILREIDHIIFVSQVSYDEFINHAKRFDARRASVIHDSIRPIETGTPAIDLRSTYGISPDKALIMFHGRVCKEKGVDVLLRAVAQLDKNTYHLVIVGEGNKRFLSRIKSFIEVNGLADNVTMLGFQTELQKLIRQADFGVLPAAWREPFGISNLEYMMEGKAHIATTSGGQVEYLQDGDNALLVSPSDFSQLAAAISLLISDKKLRSNIGEKARLDFNRQLDYSHFYEKIVNLYNSLYKK